MFPGTEKREFDCRRCKSKDVRRKFLWGQASRNPYFHWATNDGYQGHTLAGGVHLRWSQAEERHRKADLICKGCFDHDEAYNLFQISIDPKIEWEIANEVEQLCTPVKSTQALRSRTPERGSVRRKGGRNVPSVAERFAKKWEEKNLSLRFWGSALTKCRRCLRHHGIVSNHGLWDPSRGPAPLPRYPVQGIMEDPCAGTVAEKRSAWWAQKEEDVACRRCLLHHIRKRGRKTSDCRRHQTPFAERGFDVGQAERGFGAGQAEPGFGSRWWTTHVSYRELHRRRNAAFPRRELWTSTQSRNNASVLATREESKCPTTADLALYAREVMQEARRMKCYNPPKRATAEGHSRPMSAIWSTRVWNVKERPRPAAGEEASCADHLSTRKADRLLSRPPLWSKECLHTREMMIRSREGTALPGDISSTGGSGQGSETMLAERMSKLDGGESRVGPCSMLRLAREVRNPAQSLAPEVWTRPKSEGGDESREFIFEGQWALSPTWTAPRLEVTEGTERARHPKGVLTLDCEGPIQDSTQGHTSKATTSANFGGVSGLSSVELRESSLSAASNLHGRGDVRRSNPPLDKIMDVVKGVVKFEVLNLKESGSGKLKSDRDPNSKAETNPCPQILLSTNNDQKEIRKSRSKAGGSNEKRRQQSPSARVKNLKLSLQINSDIPLDAVVDGKLKQFLKGMGGMIYYSASDGGIPRIKELANFFSGKQPLLWLFPR